MRNHQIPADQHRLGPYFAGVDLGGTKVLSIIATSDGQIIAEDARPSRATEGPDAVIAEIEECFNSTVDNAGLRVADFRVVGISSPGPVDTKRGVVTTPPNFARWHDVPLVQILASKFGCAIAIENDGNAGALGEHRFGAGRGVDDLVFVGLGTGFGAGVITSGRLLTGATGGASELGHVVVNAFGRDCNCGNTGCIEAYCSGTALRARGAELMAAGVAPILAQLTQSRDLDAALVIQAAGAGDEACITLVEETAEYLGAALSSFVNALSPARIVVGGSIAAAWELLVEPAIAAMKRRAFDYLVAPVEVVRGESGGYACALGAVALAQDASEAGSR